MPILDLQKQAAQSGRIRIGNQVPVKGKFNDDGSQKMRPSKLGTFRLTTSSQHAAKAVADLLGGVAQPWKDAPTAGQWEVLTERDELPVMIPPSEKAVDSWYEMWTAAGCVRRCDGQTEQKSSQPCMCPPDHVFRSEQARRGHACRMTTRVNVLIPDLPGIGRWMLESHGYYAAVELAGTAELLSQASARGLTIPAILRLEQRETRVPRGDAPPEVRKYAVPVLEVLPTMRQILHAVESGTKTLALPPPVVPVKALTAAPEPAARAATAAGGEQDARARAQHYLTQALGLDAVDAVRDVWNQAGNEWLLEEWVQPPDRPDELMTLKDALTEHAHHLTNGDQR